MNNKWKLLVYIMLSFQLSGCVPLLVVGGIATVKKSSDKRHARADLDLKEEYGKYRYEMQEQNFEPLSFEDWLKEQETKQEE